MKIIANSAWLESAKAEKSLEIANDADVAELVAFFEARGGQLHSFRWKDWADHKSCAPTAQPTAIDQFLGQGNGARTEFQLVKLYASGAQSWSRAITKPVAGSVLVALGGVAINSGWSVNGSMAPPGPA